MSTKTTTRSPDDAKIRAEAWAATATFDGIPERMVPGLREYVLRGCSTGGFLEALLSNDLIRTFNRADGENVTLIREYARWLYNVAPRGSWGSAEKVDAWKKAGGLEGGA